MEISVAPRFLQTPCCPSKTQQWGHMVPELWKLRAVRRARFFLAELVRAFAVQATGT